VEGRRRHRRLRLLLWLWKILPLPLWSRRAYLSVTHPRFLIGTMALIRDEQGRVLILEHTYRRAYPWGLPGGYLQAGEEPPQGLAREVEEETGLRVAVGELIGVALYSADQLDFLYRARVVGGAQRPTPEVRSWRYAEERELGIILPNQLTMLRRTGQLQSA
jgi:8-oxo-dGTP diphosphatase